MNNQIQKGSNAVIIFSIFSIAAALILGLIEVVAHFTGKFLIFLQLPLIVGGILSLVGALLVKKDITKLQYSRRLIFLGAVIGILNLLCLLTLPILKKEGEHKNIGKKNHKSLLLIPILACYGFFLAFITQIEDRNNAPLNWFGRNGLTFGETLWDTDVFWGELWFNLLVLLLITSLLLIKFKPSNKSAWKLTQQQEKKVWIASGILPLLITIAMAITWDKDFSIGNNWFSSHFAYQLPAWPALIGFLGLVIFSIKVSTEKNTVKSKKWEEILPYVLLGAFVAIWLYLVSITNFHPRAIYSFGMPLYTLVCTLAFPGCLLIFILNRMKNEPIFELELESNSNLNSKENNLGLLKVDFKKILPWIILGIMGLLFIVLLQYKASTTYPAQGKDSMFSTDLNWWWPFSHWPGWLCICSTSVFILFSTRFVYTKTQNNPKMQENQKTQNVDTKSKEVSKKGIKNEPIKKIHTKKINSRSIKAAVIISLCFIAILPIGLSINSQWSEQDKPLFLVNQVGYFPNSPKQVIFQVNNDSLPPSDAQFQVISDTTNQAVYTGILNQKESGYGKLFLVGNFTDFTTNGRYHLSTIINGEKHASYSFDINENVYDLAMERALRFFYYQRCNYEVKEIVPGYPGHYACHMDDAEVWDGNKWVYHNLSGGWHDAGDYNKYNSWFQTQWYCSQALTEAALTDPVSKFKNYTQLYDSSLPDVVDEALWGALYLENCVNSEGLQGEDARYLVWETVSGYRHQSDGEARMSYWGPPEQDWTTPRRVVFNKKNSTFVGFHRGYDIAGSLMHTARLIDTYKAQYPTVVFPSWVNSNTSYLRDLAEKVWDKYLSVQGNSSDDIQSYIGKFYFLEEKAIFENKNWSTIDDLIEKILPKISNSVDYPLWFGWAGHYMMGNILTHYITYNRSLPSKVMEKITDIQANHFTNLFPEPFKVKHVRKNGVLEIFYGAERQTDMLTSTWLQSLMVEVNSSIAHPDLIQSYLDWIFGVNPVGYCLMESVGSKNLPVYHHRYSYAENPRGAVPGALPNGIALMKPTKEYATANGMEYNDEAFFEEFGDQGYIPDWPANPLWKDGVPSNPSEVWIPHDAMLIRLLNSLDF
jgi:FtsH-binding integral membrane protein